MPSIRTYTPEENLRRIRMQKKINFVVVEGSDDVPIYESFFKSLIKENNNFEIIFSGGKVAIKKFVNKYETKNSIFIVDKDFDQIKIEDNRVIPLERYSIENYFICEDVISAALSFVFKCKKEDAKNVFCLNEYKQEISNAINPLIKIIFYYQRIIFPQTTLNPNTTWSDFFLCGNNTWKICSHRATQLAHQIIPKKEDHPIAIHEFDKTYSNTQSLINIFPGKMLKTSLQRYIHLKIKEIKPSARSHFGDIESMRIALSSNIHHSDELNKTLEPVKNFLTS